MAKERKNDRRICGNKQEELRRLTAKDQMTSSFDAYDLMSRSLLSSIMGLKRKDRVQNPPYHQSPTTSIHRSSQSEESERTPHDIYREIVVECAQIERISTSNSLAECDSSSTSSNRLPTIPPSLISSPYPFRSSFTKDEQPQLHPLVSAGPYCREEAVADNPPPPYSSIPPPLIDNVASSAKASLIPVAEDSVVMLSAKREDGVSAISVEELVKLVVSAMKNSDLSESEKECPEEILRRKRQQNNKAAARYRKRQREARNVVERELEQLLRRNESLRQTIERMQMEIAELKTAVLRQNRSQHFALSQ
ncbi:bZIP transcription factor [Parelaphostrongylus tenuis]|uniref:BZIP transcription factor n=1 Tax=Parelaphostrongylus tenuis TaxID=148309 RepID=A0AAD5MIR5_PARTN|nr:bZIP transcription factor [Parelaphostrongylus tenuis]